MTDDPLSTASQPVEDQLAAACEALKSAIQAGGETARQIEWRHEALKQVATIYVMAREYADAMARDEQKMQKEDLHKDKPNLNWFEKKPMRKAGFIDAAHSAEYRVASSMNNLLTHIEAAPHTHTPQHDTVLKDFRGLAQLLDDMGLCLDQGKTFAPKTTLPRPWEDDLKTSRVHKTGGLFSRLAKHMASKDDTGHER